MNPSKTNPLVLVAAFLPGWNPVRQDGVQTVRTALACMHTATRCRYDMIQIHSTVNDVIARADLVDLVDCLRHHPASRQTPVLLTLDRWHRTVLAELKAAGLELVGLRPPGKAADPLALYHQSTCCRLRFDLCHALLQLCPHLNYSFFDGGTELVTCGAYRNRMVLGGERLRSVCQASVHCHCDYFIEAKARP